MEGDESKKIFQSMIVQNKSPLDSKNMTEDFAESKNRNFILNASLNVKENLNKTEIKVLKNSCDKNLKDNEIYDNMININNKENTEKVKIIQNFQAFIQEKNDENNIINDGILDDFLLSNNLKSDVENDIDDDIDSKKFSSLDYLNFNTEEINSLSKINFNFKKEEKIIKSKTLNKEGHGLISSRINLNNNSSYDNSKSNLNLLNDIFCQNPEDALVNTSSQPSTENISNDKHNHLNFHKFFPEQRTMNTTHENCDNFSNHNLIQRNIGQHSQNINEFYLPLSNLTNSLKISQNQNLLMPNSFDKDSQQEPRTIFEDINIFSKFEEDKIKKSSIISCDYLLPNNLNINFENSQEIENEFKKIYNIYNDKKDLKNLQKTIETVKLGTESSGNNNIGPVSTLDYLIESSFQSDTKRKKSIIENLISLEDTIFRWRKIGGDGNCFYRAVIFAYFEKIIFERNLNLLKLNIIEFYNNIKEEIFMKKMKMYGVKTELVLKILIILHNTLLGGEFNSNSYANSKIDPENFSNSIQLTYDFFLRCFNSCKQFDIGLVMLFRYKLYKFIKQNESKLYSRNFSVAIGNLLPEEYETESGNFLFNEFYEDFLLKLYKDAEKIVIYLTPFILQMNLNLLAFDFYKNSVEKLKEFSCYENQLKDKIDSLTVLYRSSHYDLIYDEKYFMKNVKYLTLFVNLNEDLKVINFELLREKEKIKKEITWKNEDLICMGEGLEKNEKMIIDEIKKDIKLILPQKIDDGNNFNINKITYARSNPKNVYLDINSFNEVSSSNSNSHDIQTQNHLNLHINDKYTNFQNKNILQSPDLSLINEINNHKDLAKVTIFSNTCNSTTQNLENKNLYTEAIGNLNLQKTILLDKESSTINNGLISDNDVTPNNFFQNNITCEYCKKLFYIPSDNPLIQKIKLCEKCLTEEIKSNILSKYLTCISHTKQNIMQQKESKEILKIFNIIFFETKLKINNSPYDVHMSCKLLGKEFNFVLNEEIKSTVCVMCEDNLNLNNFWQDHKTSYTSSNSKIPSSQSRTIFKFPCNCFCCKPSCILNYFNILFTNYKRRRNDLICFCGTQYNTNDLKLLFHLCRVNNFSKVLEKICEIFKERIQTNCMLCLQNVNNENNSQNERNFYVSCDMKDLQIESLLAVDKFCHIVCPSCFNGDYFQNLLMIGNISTQHKYNKKVPIAIGEKLSCMICNDFHEFVGFEIKRYNEGFEAKCHIY